MSSKLFRSWDTRNYDRRHLQRLRCGTRKKVESRGPGKDLQEPQPSLLLQSDLVGFQANEFNTCTL